MHRANPSFWKFYEKLPKEIQELADENYELLKRDPRHPSLHLRKVGRMWSARVGIHYPRVSAAIHNQFVQLIRRRLRAQGITEFWSSLRDILAGQCRVTATFRRGGALPHLAYTHSPFAHTTPHWRRCGLRTPAAQQQ